jgi:ribonuclease P protein component
MKLQYRLKTNEDFKRVLDNRKVLKFKSMSVYYVKNSLDHSRFGLSVSKKIGNAVTRNFVKRRFRANIKDLCDLESLCGDFVIIARASVCDMSYSEIQADFNLMEIKLKEILNGEKS